MCKQIPLLKAEDIECRVQQVKQSYDKQSVEAILLLYKDARCDMRYLDMLFTPLGWQRRHSVIDGRLYCTVEVWDEQKQMWIAKEDVGTESNTEKEKGQASDAFKRACFNIGIGRELYTAPNIKITLNDREYSAEGGKYRTYATFSIKEIEYDDERRISKLVIVDRFNNVRYTYPQNAPVNKPEKAKTETPRQKLTRLLGERGIDVRQYATEKGIGKATSDEEIVKLVEELEAL